jgi:hypothetical protein
MGQRWRAATFAYVVPASTFREQFVDEGRDSVQHGVRESDQLALAVVGELVEEVDAFVGLSGIRS